MRALTGLMWMGLALSGGGLGLAQTTEPATAPVAAAAADPATVVEAVPALWKIKGAHGTMYLLGSIHVMKKEVHWETPKLKAALAASDVLYLEVAGVDEDSVKAAQPMILELGLDQEHTLSTKIPKSDVDLLDAALKSMGMPGEQAFEPMQPWLAYLTISVLPVMRAGYDPNSGIDKVLEAEVKATKPVKGLETLSEQLHYLSDMPTARQVEMLHQSLTDLPTAVTTTDALALAWEHGDVEELGKVENDEMRVKYPSLYDLLLVKRNVRFADELVPMLKDPTTGTVFVTIGAGHLAGPDSLLKMLEKRGYPAVRVE